MTFLGRILSRIRSYSWCCSWCYSWCQTFLFLRFMSPLLCISHSFFLLSYPSVNDVSREIGSILVILSHHFLFFPTSASSLVENEKKPSFISMISLWPLVAREVICVSQNSSPGTGMNSFPLMNPSYLSFPFSNVFSLWFHFLHVIFTAWHPVLKTVTASEIASVPSLCDDCVGREWD